MPPGAGEKALWRAVVDRALDDACGHCGGTPRNTMVATEQAAAWLLRNGANMRLVCDLADLDPQAVKNRAATEIATAASHPSTRKRHKNARQVRTKIRVLASP